ncbi:MAG: response regulator transcription factor [Clostridiales bacterium]|nr:response regulator transcription factor [Clostridiales bacterium]
MKILLVEDEKRLAQSIEYILKKKKYIVDVVYNGEDAIDYALSKIYDLIILDVMLPKINGIDVLKFIRKEKITIPILLLTAKSSTEDKVIGLDSGADDYLTKPFETDELLARVRAMLRRKGEIIEEEIKFEDISLNNNNYTLYCGNNEIPLSLKEFNIMKILISNNKNTIKKEFLIEKVWGFDKDTEYNNLEVYISFLRKKLNLLGSKVEIKTARGIGYYLEV